MWLIFLIYINIIFSAHGNIVVKFEYTDIVDNESFSNFLYFTGTDETLISCSLRYLYMVNDVEVYYSTKVNMEEEEVLGTHEVQQKMRSVGGNRCGIHFSNYIESDPRELTFVVKYTNNDSKQSVIKDIPMTIRYNKYLEVRTMQVTLGDPVKIYCPVYKSHLYCEMFNPQNERVATTCEYAKSRTVLSDVGRWSCYYTDGAKSERANAFWDLSLREEINVIGGWYREENGYGILGCEYYLDDVTIESCEFVRPDNIIYIVQPGLATERYSTIGTKLADRICQIDFKLPLRAEELGPWKCTLHDTGTFINVGTSQIQYNDQLKLVKNLKEPLEIECRVPFSASHCYIISPTNEIYPGGDYNTYRKGECRMTLDILAEEHFGTWSCHFARLTDAIDYKIEIEVAKNIKFETKISEIIVDEEDPVEILCISSSPIHYCRFEDPNGVHYHLSPSKRSNNINYFGKGLESGECGIRISNIRKEDEGYWKCAVRNGEMDVTVKSTEEETFATVQVLVSGSYTAKSLAIGLPLGLIAITLILIIIVVVKRYRRKNRNRSVDDDNDEYENLYERSSNQRLYSSEVSQNPFVIS